ncbi:hypothetical protein LTR15_012538 [Elasticomyces elasticus]|nr:hypothetical protein LTR15_012538 [Elasticomyces elasticus]
MPSQQDQKLAQEDASSEAFNKNEPKSSSPERYMRVRLPPANDPIWKDIQKDYEASTREQLVAQGVTNSDLMDLAMGGPPSRS